jgi:nucleoside-diphosphate-sugar epimerase
MSEVTRLNILITGASGFVGSHIVNSLSTHELSAISYSSKNIPGIKTTFSWDQLGEIEGPFHSVVHLAGLAHDTQNKKTESDYFDVNEGLTKKLLYQVDRWNCKQFIYLSSVKAIVDSTAPEELNEQTKSTAKGVYGRSKLAAEEVIIDKASNLNYAILRPVMIYGKGQKGNLNMLHKLVERGMVFPFKNWNNSRSILSINNLIASIQSMLIKPIPSGVYFIADDGSVSTVDILDSIGRSRNIKVRLLGAPNGLIRLVIKILPRRLRSFSDKVLGSLVVDNTKLKNALLIKEMPFSTEAELVSTFRSDQA